MLRCAENLGRGKSQSLAGCGKTLFVCHSEDPQATTPGSTDERVAQEKVREQKPAF